MKTREEIRSQYDAADLELIDRLGIDPPNLEDVAENIFCMCRPFVETALLTDRPAVQDDNDDEEEDEDDNDDEEEDEDDSPDTFVDLRLSLRRSGYLLNVGSPDFDQDGRGPTGCASIHIHGITDPDERTKTARALVDDALECAAQYEDGEDIAP